MNIRNNDLIFVSFKSDGVYLNDIKFIDKKATQKIEILKLLFLSQTKALINNSENIGLSWYEISLSMEQTTKKTMSEQYIRQLIYEIGSKTNYVLCNKKFKIIVMQNHRYILNSNIVLNMSKK